jgi:hypothetical protein
MNIAWASDALFLWRKRPRAAGKFLVVKSAAKRKKGAYLF